MSFARAHRERAPVNMLPLRYKWFWLGSGVVALGLIFALALVRYAPALPIIAGDKVSHFAAFLFLMVWFSGVFERRFAPQIALALLLYGLLIEAFQAFTTYRLADRYDVLSDLAGIGAGWLIASAGMHRWCRRVEILLGAHAR